MLLSIVRTCLLYFVAFLAVKAMGKRGLAQLHPFELVVIFMISEMASVAMQNHGVPMINSIIPIATLAFLEISISVVCLKSSAFRKLVSGSPSIIVSNGVIRQKEMARLHMTIDDLEEEMRCQGYFNVAEIQYAIMETNGQFNIMPKALCRPVQPKDLQLQPPEDAPAALIIE
ncbi:MAG: DUF421 domain-containing protein, partial [Clostridiales bacterium]|nr:DUF421 domain-containing protein [Clostridiales bacterium]